MFYRIGDYSPLWDYEAMSHVKPVKVEVDLSHNPASWPWFWLEEIYGSKKFLPVLRRPSPSLSEQWLWFTSCLNWMVCGNELWRVYEEIYDNMWFESILKFANKVSLLFVKILQIAVCTFGMILLTILNQLESFFNNIFSLSKFRKAMLIKNKSENLLWLFVAIQ